MSWEADYKRDFDAQKASGPIVFNEEQRRKNLQLLEKVRDLLPFDDDQKVTDCDLLYRFLIGRHWEVKPTEQYVRQYVALRRSHHLNGILAEEVEEAVSAVMSPIYGVDKEDQPNLWMTPNPSKLLPVLKAYPKETLLRAQMHVMESARFVSRVRGVDRCTYVLDLGKITMSSINTATLGFLRELIKMLQEYYPEIMRRLLVFNTGWAIMGAWKVLKPFVDARVQDKIRFYNGPPNAKSLMEFMDTDNMLPAYGGTGKASVLDAPIQAEVARLRALTNEPDTAPDTHAINNTDTPRAAAPAATAAMPAAPVSVPATGQAETLYKESPRSLEQPEELLLAQPEELLLAQPEDTVELFSLYTSFAHGSDYPVPYVGNSPQQPPHLDPSMAAESLVEMDQAQFRSARSFDYDEHSYFASGDASERAGRSPEACGDAVNVTDGDEVDSESAAPLAEGTVFSSTKSLLAKLGGFYSVGTGYFKDSIETGDAAAAGLADKDKDGNDSEASSVASESDVEEASDSRQPVHTPLSARLTPEPPMTSLYRDPSLATVTGPVPVSSQRPSSDPPSASSAAALHVDPLSRMTPTTAAATATAQTPSAPLLPLPPPPVVRCVELSLAQSADGAVIGFCGFQRVGEFRRGVIYGNPMLPARPLTNTLPAHPAAAAPPLLLSDNDDQSGVVEQAAAAAAATARPPRVLSPDMHDDPLVDTTTITAAAVVAASHQYVVGELLRESGHPIHSYIIACDAGRKARFVLRRSRLRTRVSVYQVVGDATVATDGRVRHTIAGQKVRMGTAVAHPAPGSRRDPGAWVLYGEDVTRPKKGVSVPRWPFGRSCKGVSNRNNSSSNNISSGSDVEERGNKVLLAECLGQTVRFYGVLARSHPVDLFTLAMAVNQLWLQADGGGLQQRQHRIGLSTPSDGQGSSFSLSPDVSDLAVGSSSPTGLTGFAAPTTGSAASTASGSLNGSSLRGGGIFSELLRSVRLGKSSDSKGPGAK